MIHTPSNHDCRNCGDDIDLRRWQLGYKHCLACGETLARKVKHTIAPMHKSNYVLITDTDLLRGLNNKQQR